MKEIVSNSVEGIMIGVFIAFLFATINPLFTLGLIMGCLGTIAVGITLNAVRYGYKFEWRKKK